MNAVAPSNTPRSIVRVLACVTAPSDPSEIHEIGVADVVLDQGGARLDALHARSFGLVEEGGGTTCTPMHVAAAVWGGRPPHVLAAHDAATASLTFTGAFTRSLPWISLHKVARRVWPGQHSYDVHPLASWRAWAGSHALLSSRLPSGAERDAELAAGLLVELFHDPGLHDVAEGTWLERADQVDDGDGAATRIRARHAVDAALAISALPARPLKEPPYPFDDQREWAGIGLEDLRHHARFSEDGCTAEAARAELSSRPIER